MSSPICCCTPTFQLCTRVVSRSFGAWIGSAYGGNAGLRRRDRERVVRPCRAHGSSSGRQGPMRRSSNPNGGACAASKRTPGDEVAVHAVPGPHRCPAVTVRVPRHADARLKFSHSRCMPDFAGKALVARIREPGGACGNVWLRVRPESIGDRSCRWRCSGAAAGTTAPSARRSSASRWGTSATCPARRHRKLFCVASSMNGPACGTRTAPIMKSARPRPVAPPLKLKEPVSARSITSSSRTTRPTRRTRTDGSRGSWSGRPTARRCWAGKNRFRCPSESRTRRSRS